MSFLAYQNDYLSFTHSFSQYLQHGESEALSFVVEEIEFNSAAEAVILLQLIITVLLFQRNGTIYLCPISRSYTFAIVQRESDGYRFLV